jgi:hypothetical protein
MSVHNPTELSGRVVLSLSEAMKRLPIRDKDAKAWLLEQGMVHDLLGRQVVLWADVLKRIRSGDAPAANEPMGHPTKATFRLKRMKLS